MRVSRFLVSSVLILLCTAAQAATTVENIRIWSENGKTRVVAIFAKRARGMMADYIIRNRIENPEDLKKFRLGGYKFNEELSDDKQWTFERPQP